MIDWEVVEITVESEEQLTEMVRAKDFRIASAIVDGVFANLDTEKENVHLMSVFVESENYIFDVTIDKEDFAETLEDNLPTYIREELYEECQVMSDTIKKLRS
tara:strand:- start:2919 stop:3227 length:309 start_codon:yes stop_codon:yes gene_type:complete